MACPTTGVSVSIPEDLAPVMVDPVLMDQALTNVLDNAVRHAAGAGMSITAQADPQDGSVLLRIEDDGPGAPPEVLGRLFERFYRGPQVERGSRRGLGVGLAVVQGAVAAMGGTVHAEPGRGGGLAIVLRLVAAAHPDRDA